MWEKTLALMFNENSKPGRLLLHWNFRKIVDLFYYMILAGKKILFSPSRASVQLTTVEVITIQPS